MFQHSLAPPCSFYRDGVPMPVSREDAGGIQFNDILCITRMGHQHKGLRVRVQAAAAGVGVGGINAGVQKESLS